MRRVIGALVLVTAIALGSMSSVSAAGLQVEPARFVLSTRPGQQVGGAIRVINLSSVNATPAAILFDWNLDPQGRLISKPVGSTPASLAGWIKFNPRQFTLASKGSQVVRFSVSPPKGTSPGERRGIIFFEQRGPDPKGSGAVLVTQVGVAVYVAVEPVRRSFSISTADVQINPQGELAVTVTVKSTGNAHCRPQGTFILYDGNGKKVSSGNFAQRVVLPESEGLLMAEGDGAGLGPGSKYRLRVEMVQEGASKVISRDFTDVTLH